MNGKCYLDISSILEAVLQSLLREHIRFASGMQVDTMQEETCQWNRIRWEFVLLSFIPSRKTPIIYVILYPYKQTNIKVLTQLAKLSSFGWLYCQA